MSGSLIPACQAGYYERFAENNFRMTETKKPALAGFKWQGLRDSNPQPSVLETAVLPIRTTPLQNKAPIIGALLGVCQPDYSITLATTPAPTVRPPSRIAKRRPSSIAIGWIRVTTILMLSPGITISTPSGSSMVPVTSVVRK